MYADYAYYAGEWRGTASEADFLRLSGRVEGYLDMITFGAARELAGGLEEALAERVKRAECAALDAMISEEHGGGVASETLGKWTRNYVAGVSTAGTASSRLYAAVRPFLSGTGLLYRGV